MIEFDEIKLMTAVREAASMAVVGCALNAPEIDDIPIKAIRHIADKAGQAASNAVMGQVHKKRP